MVSQTHNFTAHTQSFEVFPCNSTALLLAAFCNETNTLRVVFRNSNRAYDYSHVDPVVFDNLRKAESIGLYYNMVIRNTYISEELEATMVTDFISSCFEAIAQQGTIVVESYAV